MGMVIYIFCAVAVLMVAGWAVYVLPSPGPMSAWELTGSFLPALLLMAGAIAVLLLFGLLVRLAGLGLAFLRRPRR